LFDRYPDGLKHAFRILEHIDIPEPQDAITSLHQPLRSAFIVRDLFLLGVLAAIQFDNEICRRTKEIGIVRPDRMLTSKSNAAKAFVADEIPQPAFGLGLVCAEVLGDDVRHVESVPDPRRNISFDSSLRVAARRSETQYYIARMRPPAP